MAKLEAGMTTALYSDRMRPSHAPNVGACPLFLVLTGHGGAGRKKVLQETGKTRSEVHRWSKSNLNKKSTLRAAKGSRQETESAQEAGDRHEG